MSGRRTALQRLGALVLAFGAVGRALAATIVGVLFGVTILELIGNALAISHTDPFWVDLLQGALVLVAVILGQVRKGLVAKSRRLPLEPLPSASGGGQ